MDSKEFGELVQAKMDELTAGMTIAQMVKVDMMEVHKEAVKLAQAEIKA